MWTAVLRRSSAADHGPLRACSAPEQKTIMLSQARRASARFKISNQMLPRTIAVEGPAASGKSTIGKLLAARLGYTFLDSGILYRFIAHHVRLHGVPPDDEQRVTTLANTLD